VCQAQRCRLHRYRRNENHPAVDAVVSDLGILLDSELSMKHEEAHQQSDVNVLLCQLRRLRQIRRVVEQDLRVQLVHACVGLLLRL